MDGGWDLGRDIVIRERADQTDRRVWRVRRNDREVGMLGFADLGQAVEAAAKLDDSVAFTQCVECVGMHPRANRISSSWVVARLNEITRISSSDSVCTIETGTPSSKPRVLPDLNLGNVEQRSRILVGHKQQRARSSRRRPPSLFPILQGAHRHAEQGRKPRLGESSLFPNLRHIRHVNHTTVLPTLDFT